eukprot:gene39265-48506_t
MPASDFTVTWVMKYENVMLPFCLMMCGPRMWIVQHLANDWLAGAWFMLWANLGLTMGSFLLLFVAL